MSERATPPRSAQAVPGATTVTPPAALPAFDPVLTPRLRVRPVQADDLPDLLNINGDEQTTHFLPYAPWTGLDDGRAWLARIEGLQTLGLTRQLVAERLDTGRVIAALVVFRFEAASRRAELGYVLARDHWGGGWAREALEAVLATAFGPWGLHRLEAEVDPANAASNALAARLGFTLEGRLRERWTAKGRTYDIHLWGQLAPEWTARHGAAGSA